MLTVVHDKESTNENDGGAGRSLLDEIVRDGARQMLAAALQAEVAAYVEQFACRRRGMTATVLAVGDGALGFWKAVREVFPATREQRCWFHYADVRVMPIWWGYVLAAGVDGLVKSA